MNRKQKSERSKQQAGIATIDKGFKIKDLDDASYFSYVINNWFLQGGRSTTSKFVWITILTNGEENSWVMGASFGEVVLNMDQGKKVRTCGDLCMVELSGIEKEAYCMAELGNYDVFAHHLLRMDNVLNSAISIGVFEEVRVSVSNEDLQYIVDKNLKSKINRIVRQGKIEHLLDAINT